MVTRILSLQYLNHATIQTPPALEEPLFCRSGSASLSVEQREKGVIRYRCSQRSTRNQRTVRGFLLAQFTLRTYQFSSNLIMRKRLRA